MSAVASYIRNEWLYWYVSRFFLNRTCVTSFDMEAVYHYQTKTIGALFDARNTMSLRNA